MSSRDTRWWVVVPLLLLSWFAYSQQKTIDQLVLNQALETYRITTQLAEIDALRKRIDAHVDAETRLQKKLDFLARQSDILISAKRSGKSGRRVIDAWMDREF